MWRFPSPIKTNKVIVELKSYRYVNDSVSLNIAYIGGFPPFSLYRRMLMDMGSAHQGPEIHPKRSRVL